jgi:hypothetical protein
MRDRTDFQIEERISLVSQPDTLMAPEYYDRLRPRSDLDPGKKLMLAILGDAIVNFQENALAKNGRRRNLFREAKDWIFDEEANWVFSFENICEVLGLDPAYVRGGLLRWSARKLARTEKSPNPNIPAVRPYPM